MASTEPTWEVSFVSGAIASCHTGIRAGFTAFRSRGPRGFTLIELMIVIAVVAILAAIAYPAYSEYVVRSRLTEATSMLADARVRMTNYFVDNRSYKKTPSAVPPAPEATVCGVTLPDSSRFSYTCTSAGSTYTATATSKLGQGLGAAGAYQYTVNQARDGYQATVKFAGQTVNATCWLVKKGQTC